MPRQLLAAVLVAALVVACLRLGWWQLERFRSGTGSWQNLGYTLQWPTFAVFVVVAWWRLRALERRRREQQVPAAVDGQEPMAAPAPEVSPPTAEAPDGAPAESDDELAAYNRYLAELNAAAARRRGG